MISKTKAYMLELAAERRARVQPRPVGGVIFCASAPHLAASAATTETLAAKSWARVYRWARDLLIGAVFVLVTPLMILALMPSPVSWTGPIGDASVQYAARLRQLTVPVDAAISPTAAGAALARVLPTAAGQGSTVFGHTAMARVAEIVSPDSTLFSALERPGRDEMPDRTRLITTAAGKMAPGEQAWLARMAALRLWPDVELVARARTVDALGARLSLLVSTPERYEDLPYVRSDDARRIAEAGIARAAWHVSRREFDAADAALRALVSFGFALIAHGADGAALGAGRQVMNIARDGLWQLAAVRGDAQLRAASASDPARDAYAGATDHRKSVDRDRLRFLSMLADPTIPRDIRMSYYFAVPYIGCSSIRELLLGPSADARRLTAVARQQLVRFPSEQLALTLADRAPALAARNVSLSDPLRKLAFGAASVVSAITGNARIAECMVPIVSWR